jgi:hypothetical protein
MKACAAGYALTYLTIPKLHLSQLIGQRLCRRQVCLLRFFCMFLLCPILRTIGFAQFRITSVSILLNLIL